MLVTENMRKRNFTIFAPHSLPGRFPSARENAFRVSAAGARRIATERNTRSISAESCGDARLRGRPPRAAADCPKKKRLAGAAQCLWCCLLSRHLFLTGRHDLRPSFSARPVSIRPRRRRSRAWAAGARCIATERNTRSISAESCGDARLRGRPPRAAADCQKKRLAGTAQCLWCCLKPSVRKRCLLSRHLFLTGRHDLRPAFSARPVSIRPRECLSRFGGGRAAKGRPFHEEVVRDVVLQFFSQRAGIFEMRAVFALQCVL